MKIVLIYNPKSGSALSARELRSKCEQRGIVIEKLIPVAKLSSKRLLSSIQKGMTIAVVGGDGTLSAVAGMIAGSRAALVPLPGGTLNHFTKDLGIAQEFDEALSNLVKAKIRTVDVAVINGTVFINNASLGLYPSSLQVRNLYEDKIGKWPAAVFSSFRAFVRFRSYTVTVGNETFETPFVFVGNNKYELLDGGTRKRLDAGKLSVFIAHTTSRFVLLKIALFTLVGRHQLLDEFDERLTDSVTIHTKRRELSISHDGEVTRMKSPFQFEIRKKALRVRY
jgi:diacylglycerol kinase family enzyme